MRSIEFDTWTLKEKEAILSVAFFFLMIAVGFYFDSKIEQYDNDKNLVYLQATDVVKNKAEFEHLMDTDGGYAFVEGWLKAVTPVRHKLLKGEYLYIKAEFQKEHAEHYVVTHSDGKRTWTTVETRWVWRTEDTKEYASPTVTFCASTFNFEKFNLDKCHSEVNYVRTGFRHRIVFTSYKKCIKGCIFSRLKNGTIENNTQVYEGETCQSLRERLISNNKIIFWFCWIMLTGVCIALFVVADNDWLDTKEDEYEQ